MLEKVRKPSKKTRAAPPAELEDGDLEILEVREPQESQAEGEVSAAALNQALGKVERVVITPPRFGFALLIAEGDAPYTQNKMSRRAFEQMRAKQAAGQQAKSKKVRLPKQFAGLHMEAIHISEDGWAGIPATAFRNAMIDACRLVGYAMTKAKMSVFVQPDGLDRDDGQGLVRITGGEPRALEMIVRLADGSCDIAVRPQWLKWGARVKVKWDLDQFAEVDIANLFARAGGQVGIGAGRPYSKQSAGLGWGTWLPVSGEAVI
jgi:hypothetical protein